MHNAIKNIQIRSLLDFILIPFGTLKLIWLTLLPQKKADFKYQLSVVCIVKNEASYLGEWIRYHKSIGVNHFYIYDNDSDDDLLSVLTPFGGLITYTPIHGQLRQLDAYNNALNRFANETKYLAVIDADEFLWCPNGSHKIMPVITKYLSEKSVGGLVVNWVIFGSSHFKCRPEGLVTDSYVYRSKSNFEKNCLVKTICNPRKVFDFTLSHAANYLPGYYAVNEQFQKTPWARTDTTNIDNIRLNHYYSKSKEEFLQKRARGSGEVLALRNISEFDEHDKNDVFDNSLRKYNLEHHLN